METTSQHEESAQPKIPEVLPVLPLQGGTIVFPMAMAPLKIDEQRAIRLVDDVMRGDRLLVVVAPRDEEDESPGPDGVYRTGTVAMIHQLLRDSEDNLRIIVHGVERVRLVDFVTTEPYMVALVQAAPDQLAPTLETEATRRAVLDLFRQLVVLIEQVPNEVIAAAESLIGPGEVAYFVASLPVFSGAARQEILELDPVDAKLGKLVELLQHEIAVRELGKKITADTQEHISKQQRDYFLQEQLRSIQRELGEGEENAELGQLRRQLGEAGLPQEAQREAQRELTRLESLPPASPEHGMIRTYLDWMVNLPWNKLSGGEIDVARARQVLDEDHYDLEKVKDRILEYLAVKKLREERLLAARKGDELAPETDGKPEATQALEKPTDRTSREPILCFVGPPGVGKTSLGQSIARSLGRKFVRLSLGGMHDEAEIRGHRRTYVGSMPGRIVQSIRRAETRDPVVMLDEIDKVGADWRGDPSSALLEVLDPAQNHTFMDNYIGVAFDLSQVLFITTANTLDTIPAPLRDRMEILQLSGYTEEEKVAIALAYLVPKQRQANGLTGDEITFEAEAIRRIVRGYTREAGVRGVDREIATVCRKVARAIAEGQREPVHLTPGQVEGYLGRQRFFDEVAERTQLPGVATGLAWTPTGGDVLFVEATMMPGREERLILTGMLGDVMRESVQAALSYVRSNAERLGIAPDAFENKIVHVHVPAGAIPKDGPSAGVTMVAALTSMATARPVRGDLAMTGEITLRGKVMPVGGIKEKMLAAHRAGIKTVILPKQNEGDLDDVPAELRLEMEFVLAENAEQVLRRALSEEGKLNAAPEGERTLVMEMTSGIAAAEQPEE